MGDRVEPPIEGNVVDVLSGEIFPGKVFHENGVITGVAPSAGTRSGYLLPGFLDAHIHIDSSLLCPSRFAEAVVPHGTTAVVTDPHEIANVLGTGGIAYMRRDAATAPLRVFFTAPSCVPATAFETSGAFLGPSEVADLLAQEDVVALGEVMNFRGAIEGDPGVAAKIRAAKRAGKPVDGHCPMLTGEDLRKYAALGISTDHECTSAQEALEKHRLGLTIMVREGSAAKNLAALAPFAREHDFLLVSDDRIAGDLVEGHADANLARAVSLGIDPLHAVRSVTIRPSAHYRLPLGAIAPGRMADLVRVRDLAGFSVEEVYIGGRLVAKEGRPLFSSAPAPLPAPFPVPERRSADFSVPAAGRSAAVRVIRLIRDEIVTGSETAVLRTAGGRVVPDPRRDVLLVSVVNRYREEKVASGFVRGFGLRKGAIASSIAHDSHNVIVVGTGEEGMAEAANAIIRNAGGLCFAGDGSPLLLPLPVGGLMSTAAPREVADVLSRLCARAQEAGCLPDRPFLTMSFLSLLVIPSLKIGDRGLFDVEKFRFVDPVLRRKA